MLGKKMLKMTSSSIQKLNLEDMGKLLVIIIVSEMMRLYLIKHKILLEHTTSNMASIAMLIGGVLGNALAFTGSCYLFSRLSKDSIEKERRGTIW